MLHVLAAVRAVLLPGRCGDKAVPADLTQATSIAAGSILARQFLPDRPAQFLVQRQHCLQEPFTIQSTLRDGRISRIDQVTPTIILDALPAMQIAAFCPCQIGAALLQLLIIHYHTFYHRDG